MKEVILALLIICLVVCIAYNIWEIVNSYLFYKKTDREFKKLIEEIKAKAEEKENE